MAINLSNLMNSSVASVNAMNEPSDRRSRRKAETRTKLVEAAKTLVARQGVEGTRIQEITEEADVGFGSFYNYFSSKDELIEVVLAEVVAAQGAAINAATATLDDP